MAMKVAAIGLALFVCGCAQLASVNPPLNASAEARCVEFSGIANDITATAYRRAAAIEQLRAQRCPGYQ
jgi:hypothetical protein